MFHGAASGGGGTGVIFQYTVGGQEIAIPFTTAEGTFPVANLIQVSNGDLYGIASSGNTNNSGTLYVLN